MIRVAYSAFEHGHLRDHVPILAVAAAGGKDGADGRVGAKVDVSILGSFQPRSHYLAVGSFMIAAFRCRFPRQCTARCPGNRKF